MIIHSDDNAANLIGPGSAGESVECLSVDETVTAAATLVDDIPANHKTAFGDIQAGEPITGIAAAGNQSRAG